MSLKRRWTGPLLAHLVPASPLRESVSLPPVRQRPFWAVQVLVFAIAFAHTLLERHEFPEGLYLIPISLFFVPVVYAGLKFGARGAIPTAI